MTVVVPEPETAYFSLFLFKKKTAFFFKKKLKFSNKNLYFLKSPMFFLYFSKINSCSFEIVIIIQKSFWDGLEGPKMDFIICLNNY